MCSASSQEHFNISLMPISAQHHYKNRFKKCVISFQPPHSIIQTFTKYHVNISTISFQHQHNIIPTSAQYLPNICTISSQHLHNIIPTAAYYHFLIEILVSNTFLLRYPVAVPNLLVFSLSSTECKKHIHRIS